MKDNISKLKDCYGCGVCVKACPVKIISLKENKDGFYAPVIENQDKCVECGLCLKVCAYNHYEVAGDASDVKAFAAWSKDPLVRQWCSSGGVGFEVGRKLINEGFEAVGVRFDPKKNRAEHYVAATVEDFMPSVGSKYIPSYTVDGFNALDRKRKYLVTGTPCQIDSFRRYIRHFKAEDKFVLLDFFCHGVPSLLLWDKYTADVRKKIGEITFASWRNKSTGWHDSWSMNADRSELPKDSETIDWHDSYNLEIREKKHFYASRMSQGDLFYRFFLGNYCLNKCCYSTCKYKMCGSAADIRIGDLWGRKYADDDKGVNSVLAFTEKGKQLLSELYSCEIIPESVETAAEGQMYHNAHKPITRNQVVAALHGPMSLYAIYNSIILAGRVVNKLFRITKIKK